MTKTKIVDSRTESFAFLGYSFRGDKIYPRRESLAKMKARIKALTPRKRSGSIESIVRELNRTLIGWFGYFRHSRGTIFKDLDAKIRSRLRRLLLKRHRKNPQRLPRQQRWPNAYFAKVGLWSLREAHHRCGQSHAGHYELESRVRENRPHGSEGGESGSTGLPYPLSSIASLDGALVTHVTKQGLADAQLEHRSDRWDAQRGRQTPTPIRSVTVCDALADSAIKTASE